MHYQVFLASYAILACRAYATSMTSACTSVTLVDCDNIVQRKNGIEHDRMSLSWLLTCWSRPGLYCSILWSGVPDIENVQFALWQH